MKKEDVIEAAVKQFHIPDLVTSPSVRRLIQDAVKQTATVVANSYDVTIQSKLQQIAKLESEKAQLKACVIDMRHTHKQLGFHLDEAKELVNE